MLYTYLWLCWQATEEKRVGIPSVRDPPPYRKRRSHWQLKLGPPEGGRGAAPPPSPGAAQGRTLSGTSAPPAAAAAGASGPRPAAEMAAAAGPVRDRAPPVSSPMRLRAAERGRAGGEGDAVKEGREGSVLMDHHASKRGTTYSDCLPTNDPTRHPLLRRRGGIYPDTAEPPPQS